MSSYKRYQISGSGGALYKWTEAGQSVEGVWRGTKPGRFGDLGQVDTDKSGRVVFPIHTALAGKLTHVREGAGVSITYLGLIEGKSGRTYKDFEVWSDQEPLETEASEEGVPF